MARIVALRGDGTLLGPGSLFLAAAILFFGGDSSSSESSLTSTGDFRLFET